jgi:hypothetical protein
LLKELDQSANLSWKDSEKPQPTAAFDKNGTTKEMLVREKRRLEKLLKRITDLDLFNLIKLIHIKIKKQN